jgi:hypothetical protein
MTEKALRNESNTSRVVSALRELITALDRRVPHAERSGETRIASDARRLRREAAARIDALTRVGVDERLFDQELAEAIMTDDGGPHESDTDRAIIMRRSEVH